MKGAEFVRIRQLLDLYPLNMLSEHLMFSPRLKYLNLPLVF